MGGDQRRTVFRTCNLCEAMCGLALEVGGGRLLSVRGDADDPFSRGHLCPKPAAYKDVLEDPDRLRRPVRRDGDGWFEVGWDEAFDLAASRLAEIQRAHGRDAVATYVGNPTVHNHGALVFIQPFLKALGTRNRYSATSVNQLPHMLAALLMFGHQLMIPVPDIDRTQHMLIFGANPAVSIGRRELRSNNSWMHNAPRLVKGPTRCTLMMHPRDADVRKLAHGQTARLSSRVGVVDVEVEVTDEVMPGVMCMPHGWGHARAGVRLAVAAGHAGASVNDVTDDQQVDALTGNAAFSATPISVEAA